MMPGGLAAILPTSVTVVESVTERSDCLHPPEQEHLRGACPERVAEFHTVRACAREALTRIGHRRPVLLNAAGTGPTWPDGVVGSMTHCPGYRAAAVASKADLKAIGIDAERNHALPGRLANALITPEEWSRSAASLAARSEIAGDRLLLCAKEAVLKALSAHRSRLSVRDISVSLAGDGTFVAELRDVGKPVRSMLGLGSWRHHDGRLLATWTVQQLVTYNGLE